MAEIKDSHSQLSGYQTDVYALSTDQPNQSLALKQEMNLPFELICDPERQMIRSWDLLNPFEHGGVAVPAIIIVNPEGIICFMSVGGTATRTQLAEILAFLKKQSEDRSFTLNLEKGKRLVIPGPGALFQLGKNFIFRGNAADWQHFFLWPFAYVKKAGAAVKKSLTGFSK